MYRILCFGDSNTWGFRPEKPFTRFPRDIRWTGVVRQILGDDFEIIEEGLNGRTTVWDDPYGEHKNSKVYLPPCLASHAELDLVVIMLGTNDLKPHFRNSAADVALGLKTLVEIVRSSGAGRSGASPGVLMVAPPPLGKLTLLAGMYGDAPEKSQDLAREVQLLAQFINCPFLDAGKVVSSSPIDGVHWEPDQHRRFGDAVSEKIREILFQ